MRRNVGSNEASKQAKATCNHKQQTNNSTYFTVLTPAAMEGSTETNAEKHECLQDEEDLPTSKRQRRSSLLNKTANEKPDAPNGTNSRAFKIAEAATQKLAKLVENHPQFHSRMEEMLEDMYKELELKVSAAIRKQKNEESSAIYKLSNDELKLCFGNLGEYQYRYIAGTSHRFKQIYDDVVGIKKRTSINNASMSIFCVKLCLAERS